MGRNIDLTKPLSEEDEAWLYERSRGWQVDEHKRQLADKQNKEHEPGEVEPPDWEPTNTIAHPPFHGEQPNPRQVPSPVGMEVHAGEPVSSAGESVAGEGDYAPEDLTVDELKEELHDRELPVSGNKDELVKRLKKALKDEGK